MLFHSKSGVAYTAATCLFVVCQFATEAVAQECPDPLASILATLGCVEQANATCASSGYDGAKFVKLHNGIDTNTVIDDGGDFWTGAFAMIKIEMDINHQMNTEKNQASVRYVEKVTFTDGSAFGLPPSTEYPFGQVYLQHEHALVTVDNDCRMILWDQYGDNKEQSDVDDNSNVILCAIGFLPVEVCSGTEEPPSPPPTAESNNTENDSDPASSANYGTAGEVSMAMMMLLLGAYLV
jgi:hypothetical protein